MSKPLQHKTCSFMPGNKERMVCFQTVPDGGGHVLAGTKSLLSALVEELNY